MPSRNVVRFFLENSFYHIYNRGVDKRQIYSDDLDYKMFLSYLKNLLLPSSIQQVRPVRKTNFYSSIELSCFCLMPNHFHLLVRQSSKDSISRFMKCLSNAYTHYYNERHSRIGPLFQGKYKAVLITKDEYLLHLSRYIHLNPMGIIHNRSDLLTYSYSSLGEYLGKRKTKWVNPHHILSYFRSSLNQQVKDMFSYEHFIMNYPVKSEQILDDLILEN